MQREYNSTVYLLVSRINRNSMVTGTTTSNLLIFMIQLIFRKLMKLTTPEVNVKERSREPFVNSFGVNIHILQQPVADIRMKAVDMNKADIRKLA